MNFQEKLLDSFIAFEQDVDLLNPIHSDRKEALKRFEKQGFPSKKDESWKYTSLKSIIQKDYSLSSKPDKSVELRDVKEYFLNDLDSFKIVFIDGVYSPFLSKTTHDGMDICVLSAALSKDKYNSTIKHYFNRAVPKDESLASLNTSYTKEGAYIYIPDGVCPEDPVQIMHFSTGNQKSIWLQPRNLIIADKNAKVEIIERHQSLSNNRILVNSVSEIYCNQRSIVQHYKIQDDNRNASLIDNTFVSQQGNSDYTLHTFSFGGELTRNNLSIFQNGERIESTIKGITIIGENQHVDHNTLIHHKKPNCNSYQDYKGIYGENSVGVFNGQVLVEKEAQKTNAFQANNNVLISDKATINTKPQLEIFADDVKCSHGCTVGQLDKNALFYLRSRGIPEKEATALLMYGFANKVLSSVNIPEVKTRVNNIIAKKLGVKIGFDI
jgi:Fe-S cluster assembly protein SufD